MTWKVNFQSELFKLLSSCLILKLMIYTVINKWEGLHGGEDAGGAQDTEGVSR